MNPMEIYKFFEKRLIYNFSGNLITTYCIFCSWDASM